MKKTIWKFEIPITDDFSLDMPSGAEILCVHIDSKIDKPCIWVLVNPEANKDKRYFEVFGTGHPIHCDMGIARNYIGTFQTGPLVFHLFEREDKL